MIMTLSHRKWTIDLVPIIPRISQMSTWACTWLLIFGNLFSFPFASTKRYQWWEFWSLMQRKLRTRFGYSMFFGPNFWRFRFPLHQAAVYVGSLNQARRDMIGAWALMLSCKGYQVLWSDTDSVVVCELQHWDSRDLSNLKRCFYTLHSLPDGRVMRDKGVCLLFMAKTISGMICHWGRSQLGICHTLCEHCTSGLHGKGWHG